MKRLVIAVAMFGAFALQGCAATCEDACDTMYECTKQYSTDGVEGTVAECVTECESWNECGDDKDEFLDCLADMECGSNQTEYASELLGCISKCPAMLE